MEQEILQNEPEMMMSTAMSKPTRDDYRDFLKKTILFSVFFVLGVFQFGTWGRDFFSILPLKAGYILGLSSPAQLKSLSEICLSHSRYACTSETLDTLAEKNPGAENWLSAANFHRRMKDHSLALAFYQKGLSADGVEQDSDTQVKLYYGVAKTLEALGHYEDAARAYGQAISAQPSVIQVTVTEAYVQLLKQMNQREAAEAVIDEARKRGNSKSLFSYLQN